MIRGFDFPRGNGNELTATLVIYQNVLMHKDTFITICKAEDIANDLMNKARSEMADLVSVYLKHP